MNNPTELSKYRHHLDVRRFCPVCNEEAFGHCPDCGKGFCGRHFPKQQHSPCAEKHMKFSRQQVCYVCGTQVYPDQWSVSQTAHYIDRFKCNGCDRYICDDGHTRSKSAEVVIVRKGLRGQRYQYVIRYCDLCYPLRNIGGIKRVVQGVVVISTIVAGIFFYLHP
jgi:hypothetical protein